MASKITINLGYKTYETTVEDEDFARVMNQHFAAMYDEHGKISTRKFFGEYIKLCIQIRAHQRELVSLKQEREKLLNSLSELE